MSRYGPNGKAHRMLARAVDGPVSRAELRDAADPTLTGKARDRLNLVIQALTADSLLYPEPEWGLTITAAGARALDTLRAGQPVETPTAPARTGWAA